MTAGIVVDDYKLSKFKEELTKAGFKYNTYPFTANTTTIKVECEESQMKDIKSLCERLELHFKRSN